MAKQIVLDTPPLYVESSGVRQFRIVATGVAAGLAIFALTWVLQRFLLGPLFCHGGGSDFVCGAQSSLAFDIATVVIALIATAVLAQAGVYRPMLVAIAAAATLWSANDYLLGFGWASPIEQVLWLMFLYGLSYVLFGWLLRTRNFVLSVGVIFLAVAALRAGLIIW